GMLRRARTSWAHWRETRRKEQLRRQIVKKHARKAAEAEKPVVLLPDEAPQKPARVARTAAAQAQPAAAAVMAASAAPPMVRPKPAPKAKPAPVQPGLPLTETPHDFVLPPLTLLQSSHGSAAVDD